MQKRIHLFITLSLVMLILVSCQDQPKVISSSTKTTKKTSKTSGIFDETNTNKITSTDNSSNSFSNGLHQVVVNEILPTERYVYLYVTENDQQFWIAARKQEVKKGETYFYRGGLLKRNFESKEYNKVFDTIYLVSSLVKPDHGTSTNSATNTTNNKVDISTHADKVVEHKGSIKISEVVKDPKQYNGKTVQISGRVTKVNPNIMQRNWIHLKDGSKDDFDLVVTSNTYVEEGSIITIKAKVSMNRDFGAGYKYDLILEDGVIVKD